MNYKQQLSLAGSAMTTVFMCYLGYKYSIYYGKGEYDLTHY